MTALYELARKWETVTDAERQPLRDLVKRLVGYEGKLACQENNGAVDVVVFHPKKKRIYDWLELQESGAVGAIFEEYPEAEETRADNVDRACEEYKQTIGTVFIEDGDSEEEEEEEEEEEGSGEEEGEEKGKNKNTG